jgi:hypothetical protein
VKRLAIETFVVADLSKPAEPEPAAITLQRIEENKRAVREWTNDKLLQAVHDEPRRRRYVAAHWHRRQAQLTELAVWPRMGSLPAQATTGSPIEVAEYLRQREAPPGTARIAALLAAAQLDPKGTLAICRALPILVMPYALVHGAEHPSLFLGIDDGSHRCVLMALLAPHDPVEILVGTVHG